MFYYIEIKDKSIISFGESTSPDGALKATEKTGGEIKQITEQGYNLVRACNGNLAGGAGILLALKDVVTSSTEF